MRQNFLAPFIALVYLSFSPAMAQEVVEVTANKFVYIFFSDTVSFVDVGVGPEILFVDYEGPMVKMIPAVQFSEETSLFVMTKGGQRKYFVVSYSDTPARFEYSFENEIPAKKQKEGQQTINQAEAGLPTGIHFNSSLFGLAAAEEKRIKEKIEDILASDQQLFDRGINRSRVLTQCELVAYDGKYIYMRFKVDNSSVIDYHFDFMKFFVENKKGIKKKGVQEEETIPVATLVSSTTIKQNEPEVMVYVFEKFTITDSKEFRIEFWEDNGDRKTELFLKSNDILNAVQI